MNNLEKILYHTLLYKRMFSKFGQGFLSGFKSFFTKEKVLILCIFLVLLWALTNYSSNKTTVVDKMSTGETMEPVEGEPKPDDIQPSSGNTPAGYSVKETAQPSDLLPQDENSKFKELNPASMNKGDLLMPDLLDAGKHLGMQSSVLRNASQSIRPDIPIPKQETGPWNKSTIEPDQFQVQMDIGQ